MKSSKTILFALAGIWTTLLLMERLINGVSSIKARKSALPVKMIFYTARLLRSALFFCLVVANVFMAIALIEDRK